MKKITLLSLLLVSATAVNAQDKVVKKDTASADYNRWTIEATFGQAKGVKPYTVGYYSSEPGKFLGKPQLNSFSLGARYMISPKFGFKGALQYNDLKNIKDNGSIPFEMQQIGLSVEGVVNASRLFGAEDAFKRFGLLLHAGIRIDQMKSKTANVVEHDHNFGVVEYNGGIVTGISPQYRIGNKLSVLFDISIQNSYRQHFNWDGSYSDKTNNLNGQLITTSLGLTYSLGKNEIHGDWATIRDKNLDQIEALEKRVGEVETLMNDTDKDGVPDYLDQENNSVAGVAVDTRGKMVDLNRNGVPDELERYVDKSTKEISEKSNVDMIKRLINEGYVTTYFDTGKANPTNVSTEGIDFIRTYLKNYPNSKIDIYGHADEIGSTEKNNALSQGRAEAVKAILVKAGIDASRLNVVPAGEDTSVEKDSEGARKLVRRVTFKIKE
ncbi:OmpA family protein [Flavobacterium sp. SUN052]|uniref:OmpA family protein n=1 Tax=Flavobacterium sp. SUN052 TaxID=3002441 RepID=UPI00237D9077|nr:OmpA family protein [Flavobacterium sp. SUN052]MEC4005084.1 OmpA family protein [Flavobacterium sp. SUN052]